MKTYQSYYEELETQGMYPSKSEERLLKYILGTDLVCLHIGVSTGGFGEIISAKMNVDRKIIATTIDTDGYVFSKDLFEKNGVENQIEIKLEDVTARDIYQDEQFDIVYARLVLHYLSKYDIQKTVNELYRITKKGGKLLVVVKSVNNAGKDTIYDEETGLYMTTYYDIDGNISSIGKRYYHSEETIRVILESSGFTISSIDSYNERLCKDYARTLPSKVLDNLIEVICIKN